MTALEICKAQAAEIIRQKQEAIRTGENRITYTDHNGISHTLYYIGGRWVDNGTAQRIRRQFSDAGEYRRAAQ